ncbi:MAG: metallophosphoesterase [Myxococcales bacterium]|nr:metallophosphoesterase [Polyangiaceae bacterium]MDW8248249.1 metallophosphoesterase [Myxococcales bacterium]
MAHTVVISDIHLCELEREQGLWMRYRQRPYCPDDELVAMLAELRRRVRGDSLTLVLNGDIFDLDAPRVLHETSRFHDLPRDAVNSVPMLAAILDDHPEFVCALGEVLAEGHTLVFIAGNHDIQLTLPELRDLLRTRLVEAAYAAGAAADVAGRVVFRAWFHRTEDGVVIEHGHQYDSYCSYRYPVAPFGRAPGVIQPTVGSLTSRLLTSRMGFFNPHVDGSFMLSALGYLGHWARHYLFSRHSLVFSWVMGSIRTMLELIRSRHALDPARLAADIQEASRETGVPEDKVWAHALLFVPPAEDRLGRVLRELWLDRLALVPLAALLALLGFRLAPGGYALLGAALGPALFASYELLTPKPTLDETWRSVQQRVRQVARIHGASAVIFGHTHHSDARWEEGVFHGNSGSWSAAFLDIACTRPLESARPVIWLRNHSGRLVGGMARWRKDHFEFPAPKAESGIWGERGPEIATELLRSPAE